MTAEQQKKHLEIKIELLRKWISTMEIRVEHLLNFEVSEITDPAERERAASKHISTIGRFVELVAQFESQLLEHSTTTNDENQELARIIFSEEASKRQ